MKFILSCILNPVFLAAILIPLPAHTANKHAHYIVTTDDFHFVYRAKYRHMVPGVIVNAETVLQTLRNIFHYTPSEKITIIIQDNTDIGGGGATPLPHNRVRLEIAPYSFDYEFTHFGRQVQWLLSHELVHIVIGDQASTPVRTIRKGLKKVAPVEEEPLTLPFSLLTVPSRYTPTWHQESMAIFMETWLNGGYGRILGSFDEMYFRTLVLEGAQTGAGDTTSPMIINLIALWGIQMPLAYLFPRILDFGATSIWSALVIGWLVQIALMTWRYRQGRWKSKRI